MTPPLDHVALVTPDIVAAIERATDLGLSAGPVETFPGEGTRECYLGSGAARLLLMQPIDADGPYARALARRGPGLHHVALTVGDLDAFLYALEGWLLHPRSVATIAISRTAWLARPGVGCLVEVQEAPPPTGAASIARVEVPAPSELAPLLESIGVARSHDAEAWIEVGAERIRARMLAHASE